MTKYTILALGAIAAIGFTAPTVAQDFGGDFGDGVTGGEESQSGTDGQRSSRVRIDPYIELSQIGVAELSPGDDVVTYTQIAAGVDASVTGRNNGGSVSLRYERNIGYDDDALNSDTLTGIARGYASVVPGALTVEAGALAARTRVDGNGGATFNALNGDNTETRTYSVYAGPTLSTEAGPVNIDANYRIGYTRVEQPDAIVAAPGAQALDVFDDSINQSAALRLETPAGRALPVGVGVEAGWDQEDIANLDQRVRDVYVRGDVTVPITPTFAVVGGVGYEDVEVSSRDALLDVNGDPVVGDDGRLVTDTSQPRQLAYDVSGLIWDVGVAWRPSTRTSLEATVGRRYDSTTYYGNFAWAPDSRSSFGINVYDTVSGFGSQLNNALANLPTQFAANRNPLTGDFTGSVTGANGTANLGSAFGSVRSSVFRSRGVGISYQATAGAITAGVGAGYDEREFIAGNNTVLAAANGTVDESFYGTVFLNGQIDRNSSFSTNAYATLIQSGFDLSGDVLALGASAAYRRNLTSRLSARAAISVDHLDSDIATEDFTTASALLGLRYDF